MHVVERVVLWFGLIGLVVFTLTINGRLGPLKRTVQAHTAALKEPVLEAKVYPGVPAAFAERWRDATQDADFSPQDHLWLTLHLSNPGSREVANIRGELSLRTAIRAFYPYSQANWNIPTVVEGGKDQKHVELSFRVLSPNKAHTVFLALLPEDLAGPPYDAKVQRQWVNQYQLYWQRLSITVEGKPIVVRYGLASAWLPITQLAAKS